MENNKTFDLKQIVSDEELELVLSFINHTFSDDENYDSQIRNSVKL